MKKILSYTKSGVLASTGISGPGLSFREGVRICPWDQTSSHIDGFTALRVTAKLTLQGLGTLIGRLFEFNQPTGVALNPEVLRDTTRYFGSPALDQLTILDSTSAITTGNGVPLFESIASLHPLVIGPWVLPQDTQNQREWYVQIENTETIPLRYSIELSIEPCCLVN